jgi:hypothetical protein
MEEVRVEGQNYALISFVSPEGAQKADTLGFRIYGAFETVEAAREHAALVNASDAAFDVYVVEMRKWCAWHPDPMDVAEKVYTDKRLDEMIRAHREAQDTAQRAYEERVALAVNQAAEKSDAHDGKELEVQEEEEPKVQQQEEKEKEEKEKEDADGDENGGDEGAQDDAQDGVGVPDHVSE